MFSSGVKLLEYCVEKNLNISDAAIEEEMRSSGLSRREILGRMKYNLEVMRKSSFLAIENEVKSISGITGGDAMKVNLRASNGTTICGSNINKAMARALSCSEVNSAMGRIVAAPTAGSCGIMPAVVITAAEICNSSEETIIKSLFTASAIGGIIAQNGTLSGAEGGCQAECGSASAMAAAAAVELAGGTPGMCLDASAIVIKCILGLICDPVAGLVEVPCAKRNAMGAVNAMAAADMALSGVKSIIPLDEVIEAMWKVGRMIPCELKETAMGGLASTPTARKLQRSIFG